MKIACGQRVFVFAMLLTSLGYGQDIKTPENYKEAITRATNLALQHDRLQASQVLKNAIESLKDQKIDDKVKKQLNQELRSALENIGGLFFKDQTQQLYETALAHQFQNSKVALDRLEDAIRIEPNNVSLLLMQSRLYLAEGSCQEAQSNATKALQINPFSTSAELVLSQSHYCSKDFVTMETLFSVEEPNKDAEALHPANRVLKAKYLLAQGKYEKSQEEAEAVIAMDKTYPEPYFVLFRLVRSGTSLSEETKLKITNKFEPAGTYTKLCEGLTLRARRSHSLDPWLCHPSQLAEVSQRSETEDQEALPNPQEQ